MKWPVFLCLGLFFLTSCGTTLIVADNPRAEIFVDGNYEGKGQAKIPRTGIPQKVNVVTYTRGVPSADLMINRRFDGITFLAGCLTYGTGFVWAWRYPKEIEIHTSQSSKEGSTQSIWLRPPGRQQD